MAALRQAGCTCAETGRALGRDHATVLHGVHRVEQDAELAAYAAAAAKQPGNLAFWLERVLAPFDERARVALSAYVTYLAEGRATRREQAAIALGFVLAQQPIYHTAVTTALERSHDVVAASRLQLQLTYLSRRVG